MNYRTKNWLERFGERLSPICFIDNDAGEGDGGSSGGDAGAGDAGGGDSGADPGSDSGQSFESGADDVDLTSTDPEVILKFPKDHRLTDEQLSAIMKFNPKQKAPLQDPTVQQPAAQPKPAAKAKPGQQPAAQPVPGQAQLKPGQTKPEDPYFDHQIGRWRDGKTNRITKAPKNVQAPPAPQGGQQPAAQPAQQPLTAEAIAAAVAKAVAPQGGQQPQGGGQGGGQQPQGPQPFYGTAAPSMVIPDELTAMIDSDDPVQRKQGIEAMMNGLANVVMRDVTGMVQYMQQQIMSQIPQAAAGVIQQQQRSTSFYDRYPELNKPFLHAGLDQVGKAIARDWQNKGIPWRGANGLPSDDFMDAVAVAFAEATGISLGAVAESAGQPAPPVRKGKSAYFNRTSSARPPAASGAQLKSAEIMGVIAPRRH